MKKVKCEGCLHPGFNHNYQTADGRPQFVCQKCKRTWTCGKDGGKYMEASQGLEKLNVVHMDDIEEEPEDYFDKAFEKIFKRKNK